MATFQDLGSGDGPARVLRTPGPAFVAGVCSASHFSALALTLALTGTAVAQEEADLDNPETQAQIEIANPVPDTTVPSLEDSDTTEADSAAPDPSLDAIQGPENTLARETALQSEAAAREALMLDVRAYQQAIEELEAEAGAFSAGLSEQLLGLGLALQRNGDHQGAIEVFKRGVHLSRINEGLYSQRQLSLLQGEIASHVAMGSFEEADERQRYLYRVQAKTLSDQNRGQALMQHALWQRQAYEVGVDEDPFARLNRMWSLYRLSLTETVKAEGESSEALLPPLYGMLRAQYLLSGFVGEMSTGSFRTRNFYAGEDSSQMAYRSQSYQQGKAVIRAIYDVRIAQSDASALDTIDTTMMLADWSLWHGRRGEAMETYGKLYAELAQLDDAQDIAAQVFKEPKPLPNFPGVRALPERETEEEGHLLIEFGVTERGRVVDVTRLDDNPLNDALADDVMRRLRQTPFRPRISDGLPVETEGLRWAYDISNW